MRSWTLSGVRVFGTKSWAEGFTIPRTNHVEELERLLDEIDASTVCSDDSSEVDPRLEEELERVLNEASSDKGDSDSEEDSEDDVVEQRLGSLRSCRDDGMKQRLGRWEREEALSVLS